MQQAPIAEHVETLALGNLPLVVVVLVLTWQAPPSIADVAATPVSPTRRAVRGLVWMFKPN